MAEHDYASPENVSRERQELLDFFASFPFFKLMGFELIEVEPGRAKIGMTWRPDLIQPAGILHGGALAALVDTSIAHSILLTPQYLEAKAKGGRLVSVDLRIKYLRPVTSGMVYSEARAPRVGRLITHTSAIVTDGEGREVVTGDSIYMMVSADQLRRKSG